MEGVLLHLLDVLGDLQLSLPLVVVPGNKKRVQFLLCVYEPLNETTRYVFLHLLFLVRHLLHFLPNGAGYESLQHDAEGEHEEESVLEEVEMFSSLESHHEGPAARASRAGKDHDDDCPQDLPHWSLSREIEEEGEQQTDDGFHQVGDSQEHEDLPPNLDDSHLLQEVANDDEEKTVKQHGKIFQSVLDSHDTFHREVTKDVSLLEEAAGHHGEECGESEVVGHVVDEAGSPHSNARLVVVTVFVASSRHLGEVGRQEADCHCQEEPTEEVQQEVEGEVAVRGGRDGVITHVRQARRRAEQVDSGGVAEDGDSEEEIEHLAVGLEVADGQGVDNDGNAGERRHLGESEVEVLAKDGAEERFVDETGHHNEDKCAEDTVREDVEELIKEVSVIELVAHVDQDRQSEVEQLDCSYGNVQLVVRIKRLLNLNKSMKSLNKGRRFTLTLTKAIR